MLDSPFLGVVMRLEGTLFYETHSLTENYEVEVAFDHKTNTCTLDLKNREDEDDTYKFKGEFNSSFIKLKSNGDGCNYNLHLFKSDEDYVYYGFWKDLDPVNKGDHSFVKLELDTP